MGTKVTIKMVPGYAAILGREATVEAIVGDATLEAVGVAEQLAPISAQAAPHYADSIEADGTRLLSTDPMAHLIEWGSIHNRAYAVLRTAAARVAARIVED